jgi:hypothetical protein
MRFHNQTGLKRGRKMLLVAVAWLYVVLMVAVVEATGTQGSIVGATVTFLLYGVLPLSIVGYLFFSPARRRARRAAEAHADALAAQASAAVDPDGSGHPPGDPVAAVREEP